ncbi:uncharacterized protein [Lolium perenne]|uniref:uncharacterized protein isoform X7 n=1 Tax=Lolium perenne TaxID=4522 RepID=UPI0021F51C42|nr:uncharacterized protein LOC127314161 isoform X12 [Lolium perenne]
MASVAGKNPLPQHSAPLLWPHPCRPSSSRGLSTPSPPSLPLATTIPPLERQESGEIRGELPAANEVLGDSHTSGDVCGEPQGGNEFRRKKSLRKVTIMQPEGISPTVGSNGSLSHATDSLIVRMIVLNRQNMSAAMEVFILPRHHDHQRACYPDDPDVEELPAMAAFEVEETNAYSVTEAAAHEAVAEESDLLFTESLLRQA